MIEYIKTNCPNCGGILKDGLCEYCGTKVDIANKVEVFGGKMCEVNLVLKMGNETQVLPLTGCVDNIEVKYDYETICCRTMDGTLHRVLNPRRTVEFNFVGEIRDGDM